MSLAAFISVENDVMQQNKQWHSVHCMELLLNSTKMKEAAVKMFLKNGIYLSVVYEVKNVVLCLHPFLHALLN